MMKFLVPTGVVVGLAVGGIARATGVEFYGYYAAFTFLLIVAYLVSVPLSLKLKVPETNPYLQFVFRMSVVSVIGLVVGAFVVRG